MKRKADTTTPTATAYDLSPAALDSKSAKIATRRESGRQARKSAGRPHELNDGAHPPPVAQHKQKEKLSEPLKACNEILMELFSKKHAVSRELTKLVSRLLENRELRGFNFNT